MKCPECQTEDIEIIKGALFHYFANHSGCCNICGCVWIID